MLTSATSATIRLRRLLHSRLGGWALALLLGAVTLFSAISLLSISGWFISAAALAGLAAVNAFGFDYFRPAAIIRLCAITRTAGRYAERLVSHNAALGLLKDLRCQLFSQLANSATSISRSGSTMHRLVTDIDLLDHFPLRVVSPWIWASLMVIIVLLFFGLLHPSLVLISLPLLLSAWLVVPLLTCVLGIRYARQDAEQAEKRRQTLLEPLTMLTPLLLWQQWSVQQQHFNQADQQYCQQQLRQQQLSSLAALIQQICLGICLLLLLWQGVSLLQAAQLSVPLLLAAALALLALNEALPPLTQSFISLGLSLAARDRLNQLVTTTLPVAAAHKPEAPFQLNARQLTARLAGSLVGPDNLSFTLNRGDILLISGASGIGKSTLLQVLAGELIPQSGILTLNRQQYDHWDLRQTIGYLPQQLDIFDLTLAQNLRLAKPDATEQELWQVLEEVTLADWARQQPSALHTHLGEYGAQVSGGQARRIALARLLLTGRPVLLLDEPFAGLDANSRNTVLTSLLKRQQDGILIIVSHQQLDISGAKQLDLSCQHTLNTD